MEVKLETKFGMMTLYIGNMNELRLDFKQWCVLRVTYEGYLYYERTGNGPFKEDIRYGRLHRQGNILSHPSDAARKAIRAEIERALNDYAQHFPRTFIEAHLHMLEVNVQGARSNVLEAESQLEKARLNLYEAEVLAKTFKATM